MRPCVPATVCLHRYVVDRVYHRSSFFPIVLELVRVVLIDVVYLFFFKLLSFLYIAGNQMFCIPD